jgi:hypothetical protein
LAKDGQGQIINVRELLETRGRAIDDLVGFRHFCLTGGSSPVATRQIREAALRAATAETAPSTP